MATGLVFGVAFPDVPLWFCLAYAIFNALAFAVPVTVVVLAVRGLFKLFRKR